LLKNIKIIFIKLRRLPRLIEKIFDQKDKLTSKLINKIQQSHKPSNSLNKNVSGLSFLEYYPK